MFTPTLAELLEPFHKLLKKYTILVARGAATSFLKNHDVLSSPLTMIYSIKSLPLTLYLTSSNGSVGTQLAQDVEGLTLFNT